MNYDELFAARVLDIKKLTILVDVFICPKCGKQHPSENQADVCRQNDEFKIKRQTCKHEWEYTCQKDWDTGLTPLERTCQECWVSESVMLDDINWTHGRPYLEEIFNLIKKASRNYAEE